MRVCVENSDDDVVSSKPTTIMLTQHDKFNQSIYSHFTLATYYNYMMAWLVWCVTFCSLSSCLKRFM